MIDAALFISDELQVRDVTLPDGTTHALRFRQLPAVEFRRFFMSMQAEASESRDNAMAQLISKSLCNEDGSPALTLKEALRLTPTAERAIGDVVLSVNGLGEAKKTGNE